MCYSKNIVFIVGEDLGVRLIAGNEDPATTGLNESNEGVWQLEQEGIGGSIAVGNILEA